MEEKLAEGVRLYEVDGRAAEREVRLNAVVRVRQREQLAVIPVMVYAMMTGLSQGGVGVVGDDDEEKETVSEDETMSI